MAVVVDDAATTRSLTASRYQSTSFSRAVAARRCSCGRLEQTSHPSAARMVEVASRPAVKTVSMPRAPDGLVCCPWRWVVIGGDEESDDDEEKEEEEESGDDEKSEAEDGEAGLDKHISE